MRHEIKKVLKNDSQFPDLLKQIPSAPEILYYRGDITFLNSTKLLAVVGSRNMTAYGKSACTSLLSPICKKGVGIVSGMALGIDGEAHLTALNNGARTCAVLASGLDDGSWYPKQHIALAKRILDSGGCLISEHAEGTAPLARYFPARNRIISGLTPVVLLIEAAKKSGTLITARYALEHNRDVMAVPGRIFDIGSQGTNNLIKQGAIPIHSSQDLEEYFGLDVVKHVPNLTSQEQLVLDILKKEAMHIDTIAETLHLSAGDTSSILTSLELQKLVTFYHGTYNSHE